MQRWVRWSVVVLMLSTVAAVAGCGPSGPAIAEIKGKVTLDGKPLTGGGISFIPQTAKGVRSSGVINAQGEFTVYTPSGQKGAIVGTHTVVILPPLSATGGGSTPGGTAPTDSGPVAPIPGKYSDAAKTDLSAEVKKGIVNEITLELKSK